jgi:hypothetical protein
MPRLLRRKHAPTPLPRVYVRDARPRWTGWGLALAFLVVAGVCVAWAYDRGGRNAGYNRSTSQDEIGRLEGELSSLRHERDALNTAVNAASSDLSVERAAEQHLIEQVKTLEGENAKLKEDLAFFDRILPPSQAQGVSIRSFQIEADTVGDHTRLRYRILVSQGAKASKDFVGQVQFVINGLQDGHATQVAIPADGAAAERNYGLSFRMFQRLEGVIDAPAGVSVRSVQLRVLENGAVRAQQVASVH